MEQWKDVVEFPDLFMISNEGRVWSKRTNRVLKQGKMVTGYLAISSKIGGRDGDYINKRVHRWVADAFIDNPENKRYVNHIDGNKENNHVTNLEWCTASENTTHAYSTGLIDNSTTFGELHVSSKLTEDQVREIRMRYKPYCRENGTASLGREFGVDHSAISRIVSGKSWKHTYTPV